MADDPLLLEMLGVYRRPQLPSEPSEPGGRPPGRGNQTPGTPVGTSPPGRGGQGQGGGKGGSRPPGVGGRPGSGGGVGDGGGGGGGDPFASDVVFLTNFDGTHNGTDAIDEGPFAKTLTFNGNAVLSNATTYSPEYGTALQLDGTGDFVVVPDFDDIWAPGATPWTLEFRFRSTWPGGNGDFLFAIGVPSVNKIQQIVIDNVTSSGNIAYADSRGGGFGTRMAPTIGAFTNTWLELAVSFDGDVLTMYRDGTVISTNNPANNTLSTAAGAILRIAGDRDGFDPLKGQIQAVRFTLADRYGGASYTPAARWTL